MENFSHEGNVKFSQPSENLVPASLQPGTSSVEYSGNCFKSGMTPNRNEPSFSMWGLKGQSRNP